MAENMIVLTLGFFIGVVHGFFAYPCFHCVFIFSAYLEKTFSIKASALNRFIILFLAFSMLIILWLSIGFAINSFLDRVEAGLTLGKYYGLGFFIGIGIFSLLRR